ncbi:hypothetical protein AB3S75_045380 [Citrus x aurantiifolia]
MVAAISEENPRTRSRHPLLPSEKTMRIMFLLLMVQGNLKEDLSLQDICHLLLLHLHLQQQQQQLQKVKSQSQRFSSLLVSRSINSSNLPALGTKRSQSVDRRRQVIGSSPRAITLVPSSKQAIQVKSFQQ